MTGGARIRTAIHLELTIEKSVSEIWQLEICFLRLGIALRQHAFNCIYSWEEWYIRLLMLKELGKERRWCRGKGTKRLWRPPLSASQWHLLQKGWCRSLPGFCAPSQEGRVPCLTILPRLHELGGAVTRKRETAKTGGQLSLQGLLRRWCRISPTLFLKRPWLSQQGTDGMGRHVMTWRNVSESSPAGC